MKTENHLLNSLTVEKNGSGKQVIRDAACQNVRPYGSNQEYLFAMREDLAVWLKVSFNCCVVLNFIHTIILFYN